MEVPNIIKSETTKNLVILYLIWMVGLIVLNSLLTSIGLGIPTGYVFNFIVVTIVLHMMYLLFKTERVGTFGKVILGCLLGFMIFKTFFDMPLFDKILNFVLFGTLTVLFIIFIVKKLTGKGE